MTDYFGTLLSKYGKRGWTAQGILWPEDEASHTSMLEPRRIGDKWTWMIPLDQTGVSSPDTPDSVLEFSTFGLFQREMEPPDPGYYTMDLLEFKSLVLKHRYTSLINFNISRGFWTTFAGPRLERLSMIEVCKIPLALRCPRVQNVLDLVWNDPDRGRGVRLYDLVHINNMDLTYFDHEIPGWYAEWEKLRSSQVETVDDD